MSLLQPAKRFWGSDVAKSPGSLSLQRLHQMAEERAAARAGLEEEDGDIVAMDLDGEVEEEEVEEEEEDEEAEVEEKKDMDGMEEKEKEKEKETEKGEEEEEGLPMVTQTCGFTTPRSARHKQADWVAQPRLISGDIINNSAPLEAVKLPDIITRNLKSMGLSSLFPVQLETLPYLMASATSSPPPPLPPRDVCICAPTGCGKTLCYVVPIVTALLNCVVRQVRCVVVVPTRSLAQQVGVVFRQVANRTRVRCGLICGEMTIEKEEGLVFDHTSFPASSLVDVVIATPGRLTEHLTRGSFVSLHSLRFLVIDEADRLLNQQIYSWLPKLLQMATPIATPTTSSRDLLSWLCDKSEVCYGGSSSSFSSSPRLSSYSSSSAFAKPQQLTCVGQLTSPEAHRRVQKLLLSATMTQDPEALAMLNLHRPILFSVAKPRAGGDHMTLAPPTSLKESVVLCRQGHKPLALLVVLARELGVACGGNHTHKTTPTSSSSSRILIFANTKETTLRLKVVLEHFKWFEVAMVTSEVPPDERRRNLRLFTSGRVKVLLCSDSMSRGMDFSECDCVINYDPPSLYRSYLHRVGRTARGWSAGRAITLLSHGDEVGRFRKMLRVARRPRLEEEEVNEDLLEPLQAQYEKALENLKMSIKS